MAPGFVVPPVSEGFAGHFQFDVDRDSITGFVRDHDDSLIGASGLVFFQVDTEPEGLHGIRGDAYLFGERFA